jgi:indole-3-glycerol phosphate synthase
MMLTMLVEAARRQTEQRRTALPEPDTRSAPPPRDFTAAIREPGLSVIAEMKPRSPSKGALTDRYRPAERARSYRGAHAISVLTHEEGFGGVPEHLGIVRAEVDVPLLRKDFVVDSYQVREARALGADAVLLIVAASTPERLAHLIAEVGALGMAALVEVHDEDEVDRALAAGARVIWVNARSLRTLEVDRTTFGRLASRIPDDVVRVAESGVRGPHDVFEYAKQGAHVVLVGETLVRGDNPREAVADLVAAGSHPALRQRS